MNIYVLRHGTTQWNLEHRIQGATDIPLHEDGRREAMAIREKIHTLPIDVIYASSMKRAMETAQIIHEDAPVPLISEDRLREVSFGEWEGLSWKEVQRRYPDLMEQIPSTGYVDPPGGESFQQASERICSFIQSLLSKKQDCLLVTHKAVIRFLVYCLTKKAPVQPGALDIPNLSILHFQIPDDGPVTWRFI